MGQRWDFTLLHPLMKARCKTHCKELRTPQTMVFALHLVATSFLSVFESQSSSHHPPLLNPPESLTNFWSAKESFCLIGQREGPLLETLLAFALPGFPWDHCISSKAVPSSAFMQHSVPPAWLGRLLL